MHAVSRLHLSNVRVGVVNVQQHYKYLMILLHHHKFRTIYVTTAERIDCHNLMLIAREVALQKYITRLLNL